MKLRKLMRDNKAAFITSLIMLLIMILVAAALVTTVSYESNEASANADVMEISGGPELIDLWPLLFIIAPVMYIVKEVFF